MPLHLIVIVEGPEASRMLQLGHTAHCEKYAFVDTTFAMVRLFVPMMVQTWTLKLIS